MSYSIFYSPDSANIVVRIALEELGVEYDARAVPDDRTDRSDEFFALNPRGLLPVLIDRETDAVVFETGAVLLYLADKHGALAPKPDDYVARAECLRWLFMLSNTLHADLARNFYAARHSDDPDTAKLVKVAAAKRVAAHLKLLDEQDCAIRRRLVSVIRFIDLRYLSELLRALGTALPGIRFSTEQRRYCGAAGTGSPRATRAGPGLR